MMIHAIDFIGALAMLDHQTDVSCCKSVSLLIQLCLRCALCCMQFGETALTWAAQRGRRDVVRLLLEQKANTELRDTVMFRTHAIITHLIVVWCAALRRYTVD